MEGKKLTKIRHHVQPWVLFLLLSYYLSTRETGSLDFLNTEWKLRVKCTVITKWKFTICSETWYHEFRLAIPRNPRWYEAISRLKRSQTYVKIYTTGNRKLRKGRQYILNFTPHHSPEFRLKGIEGWPEKGIFHPTLEHQTIMTQEADVRSRQTFTSTNGSYCFRIRDVVKGFEAEGKDLPHAYSWWKKINKKCQ